MGKPVEIEFLMRDKLSGGVLATGKTVVALGNQVDETTRKIKQMGHSVELESGKMDRALGRVLTGAALAGFLREVVKVRGEIQQLGIAFETMLGSKKAADQMITDVVDFAQKTPYTVTDVASNVKQLIAMGVASEDVMDTLKSLGDVAAGVAVPISRIAINYGQVASIGKLQTREMKDFMMAGVPLAKELARMLGVTRNELDELITKGRVGFPMVEQAFKNMSGEGGAFNNLMEKTSKSVTGQISNVMDKLEVKLNEIGEANEGVIYGAIHGVGSLIDHYKEIGRLLVPLIATVGAYKAALIGVSLVQKAIALSDNIRLIAMCRKELGLLTAAQQAFNLKALQNPYILLASAIIGAGAAIWQFVSAEREKQKAIDEALQPLRDEFTQTNLLVEKLKNANLQEERKKILGQLKEVNPGIVKDLENEKDAVEQLTVRLEAYNKAKLAEIAVKKFSLADGFEEAVEDLQKAQDKVQDKTADIIDVYSTLFTRFRKLETENADIPENLRTLFASVIDSSAPETEKVETLFTAYRAILDKVKAAHGAYTGPDRSMADLLFRGLDISKYEKAIGKLSDQTDEYEEKATALKSKISAIADAVYDNEEQRQDFILSQWAIYFPDEVQKVDKAVDGAAEKTRTWKDEIEEIVKGDYKADIEAASNIPEVIDAIQKAIKAEKERVENMKPLLVKAGFDFSGMKFPEGYTPSPLEQKWSTDFTKAQGNLAELNAAKTKLGIPDKTKGSDPFVKKLQTQIELTKSAKEEYAKLLKVMSSEEAYKLLKNTSGYAHIRLEDIVSTKGENEGYIKYLESQIKDISKRKTKEAQALVIKLQKEFDGLRLENLYNAAARAGAIAKLDEEYTKTLTGQVRQSQFDVRQAEIDAMDEGFAREQAQVVLNYDRLIAENETRQKEWIEAAKNQAKSKWLLENPDKDESQFTQTFSVADLSPEQQAALKKYTESANAFRARSEEKLLEDMLKKYADYTTQRQLLEKQYDDDIAALMSQRTAQNAEVIDRAIAEVRRQKDSAIADLDATLQGSSSLWGQLFDDLAHRTNAELRAIIDNAREVLEYVNNTPSGEMEGKFGLTREQLQNLKGNAAELGAAYDALYKKTEQFNRRNPFAALISGARSLKSVKVDLGKAERDLAKAEEAGDKDGAKAAREKIKLLTKQKDLFKGDLKSAATSAVSYLGDVGSSFEQIGAAAGDADLESFGKTLGEVGDVAKKALSGDYIGAAISGLTSGLTAIFSSRAKYRAALKQMREDLEAFKQEYKLALADIELEGEKSINIFSENAFEKAITALRQMQDFFDQFIERINKKDTLQFGNSFFDQLRKARKEAQGITTDLQNIWVQTRHSTWFRSAKGFYLKDKYPELFEGEYGFNVEAARALLETNNQLNDEAKRQIQEVIDLYDQMKEAEEAFKDYLSGTFGDIGSSLGDSIVTAFEEGTDAMENWSESFNTVLKNLAKQLMTTLFLQKHFDKLEEDLTDIYDKFGEDPDRVGSEVTRLLGGFFESMGSVVDEASDWYKNFVDQAGRYGFDLTGEDEGTSQSGKAGAFQTLSQDTGTKLEGLFTANGMRLANIEVLLADVQFGIYLIGDKLAEISDNTKGCDEKLKRVVIFMEKIDRDGVKIQ